jgi:hypothetical protein
LPAARALTAAILAGLIVTLSSVLDLEPAATGGPTTQDQESGFDRYGGLLTLSSPKGATGRFRTEKFGNRWMIVTPDGHGFWMLGVYNVAGTSSNDELGNSYNNRLLRKYGTAATGWAQANRRLKSWGFNTIGPFSYRMTLPMASEPEWPRGEHPVKMPFVGLAPNPGISGRSTGIYKNLYAGLDAAIPLFRRSQGGNFPDVFDPAWKRYVTSAYANDENLARYKSSPYFLGYFSDDTDFLAGFGSGTDFPTDPPGKYHWHLGYLTLVTAPTQATNPYSSPPQRPYAETTVHTKVALRDFLADRYGTIDALNAAWGASYTTFGSDGGWPHGRGLLDENGRASHGWLSGQEPYFLKGLRPATRADMDDFLFELARRFFQTNADAFRTVAPRALFFGPTNLGGAGWRVPARGPILKAAGLVLDVINIGTDGSQAQLDFVAHWAGDVPIAIWEGVVANADSGRWRSKAETATWNLPSQLARGRQYERDVQAVVSTVARPTGSRPYVGLLFWAWSDSLGEAQNWGLVSLLDNAYDGREALRAQARDHWGYPTGGEERDYGDFISSVRRANFGALHQIAEEIKGSRLGTAPR